MYCDQTELDFSFLFRHDEVLNTDMNNRQWVTNGPKVTREKKQRPMTLIPIGIQQSLILS